MSLKKLFLFIFCVVLLFSVSCDNKEKNESISTSQAISTYWNHHTYLITALETRNSIMYQINQKINTLESQNSTNVFTEINTLIDFYSRQCEQVASCFNKMVKLENAIIPYGSAKTYFNNISKEIYAKAQTAVMNSSEQLNYAWLVLSGQQSLLQVIQNNITDFGPYSDFSDKIRYRISHRDNLICQSIIANNSQNGSIPLDDLLGYTSQEKKNYYLNLDDNHPLKRQIRRDVMVWDANERNASIQTLKTIAEKSVKAVGDNYSGNIGIWSNDVLYQHFSPQQGIEDKGTCNFVFTKDASDYLPITSNKTLFICNALRPDEDFRITIVMNAAQNFSLHLPSGKYHYLFLADGYLRGIFSNQQVIQYQYHEFRAKLPLLSENPIIVQEMSAEKETVYLGEIARASVSCVSTIGQNLTFNWTVSGANYTNAISNQTEFSFRPMQEGTFNIILAIRDKVGNVRIRSAQVKSIAAKLLIDQYTIASENFIDNKINPGETLVLNLYLKNTGSSAVTGLLRVECMEGITTSTLSSTIEINQGQIIPIAVSISVEANYQYTNGGIYICIDTFDQSSNPVTITIPVLFSVQFYAVINPINSPVINRILPVSGAVSNPTLQFAYLMVDNNPQQIFMVNLTNGSFTQPIILDASSTQMNHTLKLIAFIGNRETTATSTFSSLVTSKVLKIDLDWDTINTDVDLWTTDPDGNRCYFNNPFTPSGLNLDIDDTNGFGPESISSQNIVAGDYFIQVHYFNDHNPLLGIVTTCLLKICLYENTSDEVTYTYYGTLNETGDLWSVIVLHFDGKKWSIRPINKTTTSSATSQK